MKLPVHGQHSRRNFQDNRVDIETSNCIRRVVVLIIAVNLWRAHSADSHAEVERIKSSAEINKKRIVDRPSEYANPIAEFVDPLIEKGVVIRHSPRTNVRWNRKQCFAFT